jgi:hypothetical protein
MNWKTAVYRAAAARHLIRSRLPKAASLSEIEAGNKSGLRIRPMSSRDTHEADIRPMISRRPVVKQIDACGAPKGFANVTGGLFLMIHMPQGDIP